MWGKNVLSFQRTAKQTLENIICNAILSGNKKIYRGSHNCDETDNNTILLLFQVKTGSLQSDSLLSRTWSSIGIYYISNNLIVNFIPYFAQECVFVMGLDSLLSWVINLSSSSHTLYNSGSVWNE